MMSPRDIVNRASFLKFPAIALTDHLSTYGHYEFYHLAKQAGVKPILGVEIPHASLVGHRGLHHLTILAENNTGYTNLVKLVSAAYRKEKEYHILPSELSQHIEGLIVLTGCRKGEASQAIMHGNLGRERDVVERLIEIAGRENVFIEMMNHSLPQDELINKHLSMLSERLDIPVVITNNDRFLQKEDGGYYSILRQLHSNGGNGDADGSTSEYYLKRRKDLELYFYSIPQALDMSGEIAERCDVDLLDRTGTISFSDLPGPDDHLATMSKRRFLLRFHTKPSIDTKHLEKLLDRELETSRQQGMSGYMIFLSNLIKTSSDQKIWLEVMGGGLQESLIAYLLDIVPLNPTEHDLVFESFSERRHSVPETLEIVKSKGKKDRFAGIVEGLLPGYKLFYQVIQLETSFPTIVREVGELFGIPTDLSAEISKMVMPERRHHNLAALLDRSEALRHLYNTEGAVRKSIHAAHALQGKINHFNLNSSRLVVLPKGLEDAVSFMSGAGRERFVQLSNATIEAMGGWILLFQHSHYLSALEGAILDESGGDGSGPFLAPLQGRESVRWAPERLDDPKTYGLISSGETTGVYLLESQGIRDLLMQIKPSSFDELINAISLYRPRPLEGKLWQKYIDNAEKKGKVYLPHPSLAGPLENTRGVLLYREQVREILGDAAGLQGERAVAVENALLTKDTGELYSARLEFIRGAMDREFDEEDAQKIFDYLLHNVAFTHDKSLSCSQAYLSYRTAFIKAHYFTRYIVSLLNSNMDVRDRQKRYLEYLENNNVMVLSMDINASEDCYTVEGEGIRIPLQIAQHLDPLEMVEILGERREHGDFENLNQFC